MSRDLLVLWRWRDALDYEGQRHHDSVGSQMKGLAKGDRLFICATTGNELYLLGLLQVQKVIPERNQKLRLEYGTYWAKCRNLSGPFRIIPLGRRKWQLRFVYAFTGRN